MDWNKRQRQNPFDIRGTNTGQTVAEAKGSLIAELIVPSQTEPLWRQTLSFTSSRSFSEQITDETVRKSMLDSIAATLPYFALYGTVKW